MKSALVLASLLMLPVAYANYATAAGTGCNQSCNQSYTEMMTQEFALKEGKASTK